MVLIILTLTQYHSVSALEYRYYNAAIITFFTLYGHADTHNNGYSSVCKRLGSVTL